MPAIRVRACVLLIRISLFLLPLAFVESLKFGKWRHYTKTRPLISTNVTKIPSYFLLLCTGLFSIDLFYNLPSWVPVGFFSSQFGKEKRRAVHSLEELSSYTKRWDREGSFINMKIVMW